MCRYKKMNMLLMVLILLISPSLAMAEKPTLAGFITADMIKQACIRIQSQDEITMLAWEDLQTRAKLALKHNAQPQEDYNVPAYYGQQQQEHVRMRTLLSKDTEAAFLTALCSRIMVGLESDSKVAEQYARKASEILDAWATTNKKISGFDGTLVTCYNGTALLVAAELIRDTPTWTKAHDARFANWLKEVFRPLTSIKARSNNWACWGIYASLMVDVYLNETDVFHQDTERLKQIIDEQIEPDDDARPH